VPRTEADDWFARYLLDQGNVPGEHEPDLSDRGITSRPDFLPHNTAGEQIACEVKQFSPNSKLGRRLRQGRPISAGDKEVFGPIRNQVAEAAATLKPLAAEGLPLVAVLANPEGAPVDLSVDHVVEALYGTAAYTLAIDPTTGGAIGDGQWILGRDGKLTNDHQYLSAVALMRVRAHRQDKQDEISQRLREADDWGDLSRPEQAGRIADAFACAFEQGELPEGEYFWVDVIDTISETAVPLPESWFDGPNDNRWRMSDEGQFEMVRGEGRFV
jgi:hypothetical protein